MMQSTDHESPDYPLAHHAGSHTRSTRVSLAMLFVVLVVTLSCLAYVYSTHERFIYFWDWNGFIGITQQFCNALQHNVVDAAKMLWQSMKGEYNLIFAVPVSAIFLWDTESRPLFIVALTALYLSSACTCVGAIIRKAYPQYGWRGMWAGAILFAIVPPTWNATMRGYPDTMGVACVFVALAALVSDPQLSRTKTIVRIAFWLAIATVIRRHLAYAVISTLGTIAITIGLHTLYSRRTAQRALVHELARAALRPALLLILFLVFLAVFDPFFIVNVLHNDYGSLYASYQHSPLDLTSYFYHSVLGPPLFVAGLAGCVAGMAAGARRIDGRFVISTYAVLWLIVWLGLARQSGIHQAIVGLPMLAIVGIFNLTALLQQCGARRAATVFVLLAGVYTIANATLTYATKADVSTKIRTKLPVFSQYAGPLRRSDFAALRNLTDTLRAGKQPVLVAASSGNLNFDIVSQAEKRFYPPSNRILAVISNAQIDSRDPLPIEDLIRANQVVTVTPFQHHIAADQQQVIESVLDLVMHGVASKDFVKYDATFQLREGGVAAIYRRVRPMSVADAIAALEVMQSRVPATNRIFRDYWYIGQSAVPAGMNWNPDGTRNAYTVFTHGGVSITLLRKPDGPIDWFAHVDVTGEQCKGATLSVGTQTVTLKAGNTLPINIRTLPDADGLLSVHLDTEDMSACNVNLLDMQTTTPGKP